MTVAILVATPHAAFGELLRISLEESGHYQVRLVSTAKEARASASRSAYPLAILDADLTDEPFIPLCYELIGKPTRLMIVPPDNNANHPSLGGLIPHGYLNRPFYLPDLLEMVEKLTQMPHEAPPPATVPAPDWASDPGQVKALLEQELPNSDAIAVLIGVQENLLGSAGQLDDASAREMAKVLLRYWDPKEKTDLMRYVRLSSTKGDYLAYATSLVKDMVLMMVFEPGAQLSQVRPQTKQAAASLIARAGELQAPAPAINAPLVGSNNGHNTARPKDNGAAYAPGAQAAEPENFSVNDLPELEELEEQDIDSRKIDLAMLLGSIPSPDPAGTAGKPATSDKNILAGWFPEPDEWKAAGAGIKSAAEKRFDQSEPQDQPVEQPVQETPPAGLRGTDLPAVNEPATEQLPAASMPAANAQETEQPLKEEAPAGRPADKQNPDEQQPEAVVSQPITERDPSASEKAAARLLETVEQPDLPTSPMMRKSAEARNANTIPAPFFMEPEPEIDPLSDTKPHVVSTINNMNQLEAASPALSLLNYTCVLLPRMPQHYLTGELADRLAQWVQHLCLAFGWRLEGISLRPEYLQWTVQVAPSVSPGNLVRIIRQRTSLHIFSTFEYIKQQNPSGDFWATGYLIVSGPQPPSAQLLREYIAQTRKRQGVSKQ